MADKREQLLPLLFPFGGIDRSKAYSAQPQGTTPAAVNVRGYEPGSGRQRGGSRPGLSRYVSGSLGSLIQDLNIVVGTGYTAPGPPTGVVQVSQGGSGSAGSATDTFQATVTAGNAILVLLGSNNTGSFPTVTDSLGNSYTRINNNSFSSYQAAAYLATSVTGGTPTITAAVGTAFISLVSLELQGVLGHEGTSNPAGSGTTVAGVNWTAAAAPDLMYVAVWSSPGSNPTTVTRSGGSSNYQDVQTSVVNFKVALRHLGSNGDYGSDLAWSLSKSDQLQGVQGGIEISA